MLIPSIIERWNQGAVVGYDIYSRLLKDRIIFVGGFGGAVTTDSANLIIAQLLYLEAEDPEKEINLYINSPGGMVTAGLAVYDTMQFVRPDITTVCIGQAASMAAVLLASGSKGKRFALPNSRILLHQPSMGGLSGQATDIDIHAKEILRMREILNAILADKTGQPVETINKDVERDFILNAGQAKDYGIIDEIIHKKEAAS